MVRELRVKPDTRFRVGDYQTDGASLAPGDKEATQAETQKRVQRIGELQELLYAGHQHRVLIVMQGMDTSGKDGATRRILAETSPQGIRVVSFKKPTETELDHDYLWRVHSQMPARGELVVFNRSHYEDVLVVRVHSLVPRKTWSRRYDHIVRLESMLCEEGMTILKFFLHISPEEQRERLQARLEDPTKRWKFEHGDLAERKLWAEYMRAYEAAIEQTSTREAPWHVVPADRKWVRDWIISGFVVEALEKLKMRYPDPADVAGIVVT